MNFFFRFSKKNFNKHTLANRNNTVSFPLSHTLANRSNEIAKLRLQKKIKLAISEGVYSCNISNYLLSPTLIKELRNKGYVLTVKSNYTNISWKLNTKDVKISKFCAKSVMIERSDAIKRTSIVSEMEKAVENGRHECAFGTISPTLTKELLQHRYTVTVQKNGHTLISWKQ